MKTNLRTIPGASQGKEDADTARAWIEVLNTVVDEAPIDELSDEEVEAELTERGIDPSTTVEDIECLVERKAGKGSGKQPEAQPSPATVMECVNTERVLDILAQMSDHQCEQTWKGRRAWENKWDAHLNHWMPGAVGHDLATEMHHRWAKVPVVPMIKFSRLRDK
jgi:hypothetical protein